MKTNTELLMKALGWQGGTVYQVAAETGLEVMEVLDLHKYAPETGDTRAIAYYRSGKLQGKGPDKPLILDKMKVFFMTGKDYTGYDNIMYWRGVLDAMKEKELH